MNLVTDPRFYAKAFQRVFLVSPSLGIDNSLDPILAHMKRLGQDTEEDAMDRWDDRWLREKLEHHKAVVAHQKNELKHKKIWSCLFILDDVASGEAGVSLRASPVLADLFTKGRHAMCSIIVSLHRYKVAPPIVRLSATDLCIWATSQASQRKAVLDEISGLLPHKELVEELFIRATSVPFGNLWCAIVERDPDKVFHPYGLGTPAVSIEDIKEGNY